MNLQTLPDGQLTAAPEAHARGGGEARPPGSILQGAPRRVVLARLALRPRRAVRPQAFETLRQRAGAAAGHVHPSRPLRHRLRGSREERPGSHVSRRSRKSTAARSGRSTSCGGIEPDDGGYRVEFDRIVQDTLVRGAVRGDRVFLAAGSLGSTELLLRARDEHRTLPNLSPTARPRMVAECERPVDGVLPDGERVRQSVGPTITSAIDFMDGARRRTVRHRGRRVSEPAAERVEGRRSATTPTAVSRRSLRRVPRAAAARGGLRSAA